MEPLKAALEAFILWMVDQLAELTEQRGIPTRRIERLKFRDDGSVGYEYDQVTDFRRVVELLPEFGRVDLIVPVDSFRRLRDAIAAEERAHAGLWTGQYGSGPVVTEGDVDTFLFAQRFAEQYLEEAGAVTWSEGAFATVFDDLVASINDDDMPVVVLAPLDNFKSEVDEVTLTETVRLVRFTDEQKNEVWAKRDPLIVQAFPEAVPFDELELANWSHVLRIEGTLPRRHWGPPSSAQTDIARTVLALRLLHDGAVQVHVTLVEYGGRDFAGSRGELGPGPRASPRGEYMFAAEDVRDVGMVVAQIAACEGDPKFVLASRRFTGSYERADEVDRLVDCWVGLEALFSEGGFGDVTWRLRKRIGRFLDDTVADRKATSKRVGRLYTSRSDVLHGRGADEAAERARETEELLRRALRRWVDPAFANSLNAIDYG